MLKLLVRYGLFIFFLLLAAALLQGIIHPGFLNYFLAFEMLASFIAGVLFTSFLTAPLGSVLFYILGENGDPYVIAAVGGVGAMLGDLFLVKLFRDSWLDLEEFGNTTSKSVFKKVLFVFKKSHFRSWVFPLIGSVIIASPLPDELGLMLLSASGMKFTQVAMFSYVANTTGILFVTLIPKLLQAFN